MEVLDGKVVDMKEVFEFLHCEIAWNVSSRDREDMSKQFGKLLIY